MCKFDFTYFMIILLRFTACYALFNEEFGFAAIWFSISEIVNILDKLSK